MCHDDQLMEPTHPCPICGKEIPESEPCCPECTYLYLDILGIF